MATYRLGTALAVCALARTLWGGELAITPLAELKFLKDRPFREGLPIRPDLQPLPLPQKEVIRKEIEPTVSKKRSWIRYVGYPIVGLPRDIGALACDTGQYAAFFAAAPAAAGLAILCAAIDSTQPPGQTKAGTGGCVSASINIVGVPATLPFGLVSGLFLRPGSGDPPAWCFVASRSPDGSDWTLVTEGKRKHFLFPHLNTWQFATVDHSLVRARVEDRYALLCAKVKDDNQGRAQKRARIEEENATVEAWNRTLREELDQTNARIRQHNAAMAERVKQLQAEARVTAARVGQLITAYNKAAKEFNAGAARGELLPFARLSLEPPNLYAAAVRLEDDGDERLMGGETAALHFEVLNAGPGDAWDVEVKPIFEYDKVTVKPIRVGSIPAGQKKDVKVPVSADTYASDGKLKLRLDLIDFEHLGRPLLMEIPIVHKPLPTLRIAGVETADGKSGLADGNGNGIIENGETIQIAVRVINEGEGQADAVSVALEDSDKELKVICGEAAVGRIAPQESRETFLGLQVPRRYGGQAVSFRIRARQREGLGETDKSCSFPVTQRKPKFSLSQKLVDGSPGLPGYMDGQLQVGETAELQVQIQNVADMDADGVELALDLKEKDTSVLVGRCRAGKIPGGRQSGTMSLSWQIGRRFQAKNLRLALAVSQDDFPTDVHDLSFPVYPEKLDTVAIGAKTAVAQKRQNLSPIIVVSSPRDGATVEDPNVRVTATVADDMGLVKVTLEVEGSEAIDIGQKGIGGTRQTQSGGKRLDIDESVTMLPGERKIVLRAVDTDGAESVHTARITYSPRQGTLWLVAIGIDEYKDSRLRLSYAAKDAQAFHDFYVNNLPAGYKRVIPNLLLNDKATKVQIERAITTSLSPADKDDTILIYFSGHGGPDSARPSDVYLWPVEVKLDDMYPTAVDMAHIKRLVNERYRACRVILVADACHAGNIGESHGRGLEDTRAMVASLSLLASASGRLVFSASEGSELSREDPTLDGGHGVFTYYLLQALQGNADSNGDMLVTAREAYDYVYTKVKGHTDGKQHPRIDGTGNFGTITLATVRR